MGASKERRKKREVENTKRWNAQMVARNAGEPATSKEKTRNKEMPFLLLATDLSFLGGAPLVLVPGALVLFANCHNGFT